MPDGGGFYWDQSLLREGYLECRAILQVIRAT